MAQKVTNATTNVQGEIFGRNPAIQCLKKALARHGIRIDLAHVFENRQSYELLAVYFDQVPAEDASQKFLCTPKAGFLNLVRDQNLLAHYRLLLPKPPAVIEISVDEISGGEASALLADACSPA